MLPGKQDVADSRPVAVDAQKSEGEGNLRNPRAPSLNQEVDKNQTERSQQGEHSPVFGAGEHSRESNSHGVKKTLRSIMKEFFWIQFKTHLKYILYVSQHCPYFTIKYNEQKRNKKENLELDYLLSSR